ncbi:hypothetical protein BKA64DRAFT_728802 [Cadophora sp. MPI-SDFR-AT-0126]|nr:hypothetical protein BKA64DRAFT_728802 [Leotiomycetes sp. MPI-SDFR-AT-0126]
MVDVPDCTPADSLVPSMPQPDQKTLECQTINPVVPVSTPQRLSELHTDINVEATEELFGEVEIPSKQKTISTKDSVVSGHKAVGHLKNTKKEHEPVQDTAQPSDSLSSAFITPGSGNETNNIVLSAEQTNIADQPTAAQSSTSNQANTGNPQTLKHAENSTCQQQDKTRPGHEEVTMPLKGRPASPLITSNTPFPTTPTFRPPFYTKTH